jgi:hypothetical protein
MGQSLLCSSMIYGFHSEEAPNCDLCVMAPFHWYMIIDVSIEPAASVFSEELVVWFRGCELTRLYSVGESGMDMYGRLRERPTVEGRKYWEKSYRNVTFLRQIPHRLTSERTRDFAVRERGVIVCGMAYINTDDWKTNLLCGTHAVPKPGNYRKLIAIEWYMA